MNAFTLYTQMQTLLSEKEKLDERISAIRDQLKSLIPPSSTLHGIAHTVTQRRNVRWAEACKRIIDMLVAESKRGKAWVVVEQLTTDSEVHSYRPSETDLAYGAEYQKGAVS